MYLDNGIKILTNSYVKSLREILNQLNFQETQTLQQADNTRRVRRDVHETLEQSAIYIKTQWKSKESQICHLVIMRFKTFPG